MLKTIISEGKTTNEAIEKGLRELKVSKDKVDIKVLENEEKRSFFSILSPRVVKVQLSLKEDDTTNNNEKNKERVPVCKEDLDIAKINVEKFMKEFTAKLSIDKLNYEVNVNDSSIYVNIDGQKVNYLIGYRGEVLNSIQTVLSSIANKKSERKIRVILDIQGYREKRKKVLEDLAERIARNVVKNRKSISLEPMSAYERKIIHNKLQNSSKVKTYSVGEEPYRKVIVALKKI